MLSLFLIWTSCTLLCFFAHDDVIKWTSSNGSIFRITGPLWGQSTGHRWIPLTTRCLFSLIYAWTNGWVNNRDAGDLRHHHAYHDVTVMRFYSCMAQAKSCNLQTLAQHDDVIKWKHFPRNWPLSGEFTGHRWIPHTKACNAGLWCFLRFALE